MKRSAVIEKMAEILENNFDGDNGCWESDAEKVLDYLENVVGMRPPVKDRCPVLFTDKFVWEKE